MKRKYAVAKDILMMTLRVLDGDCHSIRPLNPGMLRFSSNEFRCQMTSPSELRRYRTLSTILRSYKRSSPRRELSLSAEKELTRCTCVFSSGMLNEELTFFFSSLSNILFNYLY